MILETKRLILRPWNETDAESLFEYAKDPNVGPIAGWLPHTSIENSRDIIKNVLSAPETYAVCLKESNRAIGSIGLMTGEQSNLELSENEGEIGFWLGKPYWGRGLIPEATRELIRHAFVDLYMETLWCGYFDGNEKSKRCQEKCGFTYHHTNKDVYWKLMNDIRTEHITRLTKEEWKSNLRKMKKLVIYIHGKGGTASEAEHYKSIFPDCDVIGFDYKSETPWEAVTEFTKYYDEVSTGYDEVYLIANSIGAYFSLCSLQNKKIKKAFFISPVADMEKLISDMMIRANVTEDELKEKGEILTDFGETLSWEYLSYVRNNPINPGIPIHILYGENDNLVSYASVLSFAEKTGATLDVMKNGEHWFHTDEQMKLLDEWLKKKYNSQKNE